MTWFWGWKTDKNTGFQASKPPLCLFDWVAFFTCTNWLLRPLRSQIYLVGADLDGFRFFYYSWNRDGTQKDLRWHSTSILTSKLVLLRLTFLLLSNWNSFTIGGFPPYVLSPLVNSWRAFSSATLLGLALPLRGRSFDFVRLFWQIY